MRQPKFSFIDHRAVGWYYPWVMEGRVPTSSPLETKMRIAKQAGFDGIGTSWWDLVSFYQERGALSQLKTLTQQLHLPLTGCTFAPESEAVLQHAEDDCGAAPAGRVVKRERHRIERSEVNQSGEVLAARLVGGEKQTRQLSRTAKASRPTTSERRGRFALDTTGQEA